MQAGDGHIWIGTESGLNILDPVTNTIGQFIHQDADATSLPPGAIRAIQKSKNGHTAGDVRLLVGRIRDQ